MSKLQITFARNPIAGKKKGARVAKKRRSPAQLAATRKLVALNKKRRAGGVKAKKARNPVTFQKGKKKTNSYRGRMEQRRFERENEDLAKQVSGMKNRKLKAEAKRQLAKRVRAAKSNAARRRAVIRAALKLRGRKTKAGVESGRKYGRVNRKKTSDLELALNASERGKKLASSNKAKKAAQKRKRKAAAKKAAATRKRNNKKGYSVAKKRKKKSTARKPKARKAPRKNRRKTSPAARRRRKARNNFAVSLRGAKRRRVSFVVSRNPIPVPASITRLTGLQGQDILDMGYLMVGGALYTVADKAMRSVLGSYYQTVVNVGGPVGPSLPNLAAGLALRVAGTKVRNKQVQALGDGLMGAAIVAIGIQLAQKVPALASAAPMSGIDFVPAGRQADFGREPNNPDFGKVDYTPRLGMAPQMGQEVAQMGNDGFEAQMGSEYGLVPEGMGSLG